MRIFKAKKSTGLITAALVTIFAGAAVAYAAATWGPTRPTFTWDNPADHITFNSITNNPVNGDERQFLQTRDLASPTSALSTSTTVHDGEDVVMQVYFHNNAASNLNLTATNTQVKFNLPSDTATTLSPTAYISADNATPGQVYATADLTSSSPFSVTYEPGTAKLYTNYVNGAALSDNVVTGGTLVGSNGPDGRVPGCAQFSGYVTIRVKIHVKPTVSSFTATASAKATASAEAICGKGSGESVATATASAEATASATSNVSQADADQKAKDAAQTKAEAQAKASATASASAKCSPGTVPPVVTVTTGTPPSIPNTGAAGTLAIFGGVSALAGVGHYIRGVRRLSKLV